MFLTPVWRISASAALLGLGQNGLLVALPLLLVETGLSLAQWGSLLMLGSLLFLVGSPFWGKVADRHGARLVVVQALLGYMFSFAVIGIALWVSAREWVSTLGLLLIVAGARIVYGLTVSGMVPACQQWALGLPGNGGRLAAVAAVSAGLSTGRLLGPLLAAVSLAFSVYGPFMFMVASGLLALLLLAGVPQATTVKDEIHKAESRWQFVSGKYPYLLLALLLASSISVMQLGLPPALQLMLTLEPKQASYWMGMLLALSATGSLLTQLLLVRRLRMGGDCLLAPGVLGLLTGYGLLVFADSLLLFCLAVVMVSCAAAIVVPGYTEAATRGNARGAKAGYISMAHTLGYAAAALTVVVMDATYLLNVSLLFAFMMLVSLSMLGGRPWSGGYAYVALFDGLCGSRCRTKGRQDD